MPVAVLTTHQAAERLEISHRRVLQLINEGRLPAERFGQLWMIQTADLKWVRKRKSGAGGHNPKMPPKRRGR